MTERELLIDCLMRLNSIAVDYYVTGSMASNYWGIPRSTHDLDFVICLAPESVGALVSVFSGPYYIDEQSVRAAFRPPWQFNAIDTRSALKVDFWLPKGDAFESEMLRRRVKKYIFGVEGWIASAEDVILHKLVWNKITPSNRQLYDAAGVWSVQGKNLDSDYLRRWAVKLEVDAVLEQIATGKLRPKST